MPRLPATPSTRLGQAMQARRGETTGDQVAAELGITSATYYRTEAGRTVPTTATARALAPWLGWTLEAVLDAAEATAAN